MQAPKILVTRKLPQAIEHILEQEFNADLNETDTALSRKELQSALQTYDIIFTTITDDFGSDTLNIPQCRTKLLCNYGAGFSHICKDGATKLGLQVTNTPDVLSDCTADLAIMMMLMAARRAHEGERELRADQWAGWRPTHMLGTNLRGKTLGVLGFGRIGQMMAQRAYHGFGMKILAHNRRQIAPEKLAPVQGQQASSFEEFLAKSDVISLHCPGGAENTHLFNVDTFAKMKPSALLINTARGEVIDETALAHALAQGEITGAALDVYEQEPHVPEILLNAPNLTLLPHLGSATLETREAMGHRALSNLRSFLAGETPADKVL